VSRGKSEVYLKDQGALDDYLVQQGIDGAVLRLGSGAEMAGQDLIRVVEEARQLRRVLDAFPTHYPRHILEQAAIAGAFVPGAVDANLQGIADQVAERLNQIALNMNAVGQAALHRIMEFACRAFCVVLKKCAHLMGP
jgi:DNA gyrase subunit B